MLRQSSSTLYERRTQGGMSEAAGSTTAPVSVRPLSLCALGLGGLTHGSTGNETQLGWPGQKPEATAGGGVTVIAQRKDPAAPVKVFLLDETGALLGGLPTSVPTPHMPALLDTGGREDDRFTLSAALSSNRFEPVVATITQPKCNHRSHSRKDRRV